MRKKLTTTVEPEAYEGLHAVIGRWRVPHVGGNDLQAGYAAMAADEARDRAASARAHGLLGDGAGEPRPHG